MSQLKSTSVTGNLSVTGNILASKLIKLGGTASQLLCADGSVMNAPSAGLGTVTSVAISSSNMSVTGSPITGSGTITINHPTTTAKAAGFYKVGYDTLGHVVLGDTFTLPAAQIQSDWKQTDSSKLDFIKNKPTIPTVNNGTLTMGTSGTGVSGSATFTANQSSAATFTITLDSSSAGNRGANKVVLAKAAGQIDSEKYAITSGATTKATWQYNSSTDCIELVWA